MQNAITEIAGSPYPDQFSYFRNNCRNYKINQYWLNHLKNSLKEQNCPEGQFFDYGSRRFHSAQEAEERCHQLKRNLDTVDETLESIRIFYGRQAETMVKEAYILGKSRKEIAAKYHLSENMLQRRYRCWLENVIDVEEGEKDEEM